MGGALAVTALFALSVAVVLTAAAGARRTQTAYPRMVEAVGASDVLANPDLGVETALDFDAVEALPGVDALGVAGGMYVVLPDSEGRPDFSLPVGTGASADGESGYTIDRPLLSEGQLPDPDSVDEVLLDPDLAEVLDVSVGETTTLLVPDLSTPPTDGQEPEFVPVEFTVTGLGLLSNQILTDEAFDSYQMLLTPAFFETYRPAVGYWGLGVVLDDPSPEAVLAFRRSVDALVPDEGIEYRSQAVDNDAVRRAVAPQVAALYLFAALFGLAALVVMAQGFSRQLVLTEREARTLQSLGLTRRALFLGGMLRALALTLLGAAIGGALAVMASSRFPIGFVRRAEPSPGVDVNLAILAGGALVAVLLVLAFVALPIWHGTGLRSRAPAVSRPAHTVRVLRRWGAGPALVSGVHLALAPPPGRSMGRVRASLAGGVLVVAILGAASTIGASLEHLVDTPALYGWDWDASVEANSEQDAVVAAMEADPQVAAWSPMAFNRLTVNGVPIPAVGVSPTADAITPTIVDGRPPTDGDEIVLGGRTMERLDAAIGTTVSVTSPDGVDEELDVVGRAVFPGLGTYGGSERTELGTGAMTTIETLETLGPAIDKGAVVVRLAPGADRAAFGETMTAVLRDAGAEDEATVTMSPRRPTDIVALSRVRSAPGNLALLLAGVLLVQVVIALVTSGRSRRHDLALLGTIGFVRRQVATTVCWQTVTFVLIALVAGIPLGIAVGRALWTVLSDQVGVVPDAVSPTATILLIGAAILAGGVVISYAVGALLARTRPAPALRSE